MMFGRAFPPFFLMILLPLFFGAACSEKGPARDGDPGMVEETRPYTGPAWPALALLETGENPLWFELGPEGPALIESPSAASLTPYAPWPHARFITGIQIWDGYLVMAVNRDGFLILGPADPPAGGAGDSPSAAASSTGIGASPSAGALSSAPGADTGRALLYRAADSGFWAPYTTESFFIWEDKPAALLYRNDFFAESTAPSPRPQVYVLDKSSPVPLAQNIPALENFPSDGPWEAEILRRGPGGSWYYRMKEKDSEQGETVYYRANDLAKAGTRISVGEWRSSDYPENPENVPAHFSAVLARAAALHTEGTSIARTVSPDFEGPRFFKTHARTPALGAVSTAPAANPAVSTSAPVSNAVSTAPVANPAAPTPAPAAVAASTAPAANPAALTSAPVSTATTAPAPTAEGGETFTVLHAFYNDLTAFVLSGGGRGFYANGNGADVKSFSLPALPEGFIYTGVAFLNGITAASWEEQQEAGIGAAGFMVLMVPGTFAR